MADPVEPKRVTVEDAVAAALAEIPPDPPAGGDDAAQEPATSSPDANADGKVNGAADAPGKGEDVKGASEGADKGEAGGAEAAGDSVDDATVGDSKTEVAEEPAAADPDKDLEDIELDALLKKHVPAQYAQVKRRVKQVERGEAELEVNRQSFALERQNFLRQVERYASDFDAMDKDPGVYFDQYCKIRNKDPGDVLLSLNRHRLGMTPRTPEAVEASETVGVRRELNELKQMLASEREERVLSKTLRRALDQGKEKYPNAMAADAETVEADAMAVYRHLRQELRRDPTAEEVFAPVEEKYEFEAFKKSKAGKSAPASAPKSQMANGSRSNPAATEQTVTPGDGAPKANARSVESPGTISNTLASERSGAGKQLASVDARREAAVEEALRGMRTG